MCSGVAKYSAPPHLEIGQKAAFVTLPDTSVTNCNVSGISATNSAYSANHGELQQDLKDVHSKRLLLDLSEAASL